MKDKPIKTARQFLDQFTLLLEHTDEKSLLVRELMSQAVKDNFSETDARVIARDIMRNNI